MLSLYLKDDADWTRFCQEVITPVVELEKGKLGQDGDRDKSGFGSGLSDNIFDDDFMRSDFPLPDSPEQNRDQEGGDKEGKGETKE